MNFIHNFPKTINTAALTKDFQSLTIKVFSFENIPPPPPITNKYINKIIYKGAFRKCNLNSRHPDQPLLLQ